jgi:alkylation response protein AidB-like acyl-CoA dehydrogenase
MSVTVRVSLPDPFALCLRESAARTAVTGAPDATTLAALRDSGLLAAAVPVECGGGGAGAALLNQIVERVAVLNPSVAIILFQHFAVTARIAEWGSAAQRRTLLPELAAGRCLAASACSEPGIGAAKKKLGTTGVRRDDGQWLLNGAKSFTTGAGIADLYLVLVQTSTVEDEPAGGYGSRGQSFFLIPAGNPGLVPDLSLDLVGMRGSATGFVELHDCVVGDDARLGPLGEAPTIIAGVRETGASLGAVAVGIAQSALDLAVTRARRDGAVGHRLVDLGTRVEAARALVARAGLRASDQPGVTTLHSKLFATTTAEQVVIEVARLLGSMGFMAEHQVNRLLADARAVALMGPTDELCRDLVAASWTR